MHYNNDHDPSHGSKDDAEAYARMGRNHPNHPPIGKADTESWSTASVLQASIQAARNAVVTRDAVIRRARNAATIKRLLFVLFLVGIAVMCAIGADAAIRAGVNFGIDHTISQGVTIHGGHVGNCLGQS